MLDRRLHTVVDLAGKALVVGSVEHAGTGPHAAPLLRVDGACRPLYAGGTSGPKGGEHTMKRIPVRKAGEIRLTARSCYCYCCCCCSGSVA